MENIELLKKYVSMTDDQWVMRQRLLRFYDKAYNHRGEEFDRIHDVLGHFMVLGMKSIAASQLEPETANEIISHEADKVKLEFLFNNGATPTKSQLKTMMQRLGELRKFRSRYYRKVDKFQFHYQISGLTMVDYEFTDFDGNVETVTLPGWDESVPLELIHTDLDILSQWKDYLYFCWVNRLKNFKVCRWNETKRNYELTTLDYVESSLSNAKWANPYIYDGIPSISICSCSKPDDYGHGEEILAIPKHRSVDTIPI